MISLNLRKFCAVAAVACAGFASSASASNITVFADNQPDLSGSITLNLAADQTGLAANQYRFDVALTNDDNATWTTSTITSFYVLSNPASTYVSNTGNYSFGQADVTLPPSTTVFNFCLETDSNNNCGGNNPNGGVGEGQTQNFSLVVSSASQPVFFGAALRWQQLDGDLSAKGECIISDNEACDDDPGTGPKVPVPAGLPLMLTAIGIGAYMRKRARKTA